MAILTTEEKSAVTAYTSSYYRAINACLRGDGGCDDKVKSTIEALDRAIAKSLLPAEQVVFRGVSDNYASYLRSSGLRTGSVVIDDAYVSTSRDPKKASFFAAIPPEGLIMKIHIPAGSLALDVAPYSDFPAEEEILLPRGTKLRVTGYDSGTRTLEMEVI
ncbi:ADP-ribosyltransferase [Sphingosinicella sp. LHD-64]|uniref:ADP-ribosyltransferase n=1 Tax=Sphingosinicella sp. LHD-64 TaxID=3072139 RepID=UPI00280E4631|nr:ADP-ribosyltransferase [Sphingosinicella sp. LHD-64]MDQ8757941.1 ADP-ribosyltransferase [Sphingosinicella sp. LHD-64]